MKTETLRIAGVPAVLYGEDSDKIVLYLHGKYGRKEEALALAPLLQELGWQILAVDLPEHGDRAGNANDTTAGGAPKKCFPWVVIPEWQAVVRWLQERYEHITFCAVSLSAWFLMRTFRFERFERCLFLSPVVDMRLLIEDKMKKAGITAGDLGWKQSLPDADGEMIVWDFYAYAAYQPISRWDTPTEILYASGDTLQPETTMRRFSERFGCGLTIIEGSHYIPLETPELQNWVRQKMSSAPASDGYDGLDYILDFPTGKDITVLQITDAQAMRYEGIRRSFLDEHGQKYSSDTRFLQVHNAFFRNGVTDPHTRAWLYIEEGIQKTAPDLLVLTGDNIYGETDDNGTLWQEMADFLDSFGIPWLCLYGNHDNESQMGVHWQSDVVRNSKHGILKEGTAKNGNCNYSVGIRQGDQLRYVFYMLDTNGCRLKPHNFGESLLPYNPDLSDLQQTEGIFPDQLEWIRDCGRKTAAYAPGVPSMMFMHIPPIEMYLSVSERYRDTYGKWPFYANRDGDMGTASEAMGGIDTAGQLMETAKEVNCVGIFAGHQHKVATSTFYDGIRMTYGLKTGTGDYHDPTLLGTTKITLREADNTFDVEYIFSDIEYPL